MATTCADPAVLWGLFSAAFGGNLAKVKTLLNTNSLSSDVTDPKTGSTALLWASSGGSLEVVEWLVKEAGAKATHHNKDNCTAFYYACEHCHKPVAEFLVGQRGVNVNDKDNSSGHSVLHRLCIAGQTREAKAAEAKAIISWLITECDADVHAVDLAGRLPGEANLSTEAPNLQPTTLAIEIKEMLEDARQGRFPGTPKTDTSTIPSPCTAVSPTRDSSSFFEHSPVESDRPMRKPKSEVKSVPEPRSEPVAPTRAPETPPTAASKYHATELPAVTIAEPVVATSAPQTPPTATSKFHASERPAVTITEPISATRGPQSPPTATSTSHATGRPTMTLAAARAAAAKKSSGAPVGIVKTHSPSSLRHPPSSPPWNSPPPSSRTAERAAEVSTKSGPALTSRPPAQVVTEPAPAKASSNPSAASYKKSAASPGPKSPSSSPPPLRQTEQPTSPPWNIKLRPGGVKPRSGNGSPATASTVPAERGGEFVAPAISSAGEVAASEKAPTLVKQYSHGKKSGTSTAGNGDVAPSSAPMVRFPRNSAAPPTSGSSAGAAAAVIGASHGPKASALAAAFENKTKSRQASPSAGTSGGNGSGPSMSREVSSGSDGSGRGVDVRQRSGTQARARSAAVEQVTPEELLGKGSVMQRTQIYVAAAKKGSQGAAAAAAKDAPATQLGKGKKGKEGSILDKLVSMFTVSPESSPSSSPTRSVSKSPQGKPRSPMGANGAAANGASTSTFENARLGFFHTNKSFKMDSVDKE